MINASGRDPKGMLMPIHDWTRVESGIFHDFHGYWIQLIKAALNAGLLPPEYYALAEQVAVGVQPDVIALKDRAADSANRLGDAA